MALAELDPGIQNIHYEPTLLGRFLYQNNQTVNWLLQLNEQIQLLEDSRQTRSLIGGLSEQQLVQSGFLIYDKTRYFVKSASNLGQMAIEQCMATDGSTIELLGHSYPVNRGHMTKNTQENSIVYGDVEFTNEQLAEGWRTPSLDQWSEWLTHLKFEGVIYTEAQRSLF
jgi:hypothetical protein